MLIVPLNPVPNQQVQQQLGGQATTLNVYQQAFGLYVDVLLGSTPVVTGVIAENLNRVIRDAYLGYQGDFVFIDTEVGAGGLDPVYTGLGGRFVLAWLSPADLAAIGLAA